jgi:hypothetical protein
LQQFIAQQLAQRQQAGAQPWQFAPSHISSHRAHKVPRSWA